MDIQVLSNGFIALLIGIGFFALAIATWRLDRIFAPGLSLILGATWLRFSGRFAERGGGPEIFSITQEWVITVNYVILLVAVFLSLLELVWVGWGRHRERMDREDDTRIGGGYAGRIVRRIWDCVP